MRWIVLSLVMAAPAAAETAPRLEPLWVLDGFSDPEGVAFAPNDDLFISNVAGEADGHDREGWVSRISRDGAMIEARWAERMNAPKGMVVRDGQLFVADIDTVRVLDVETGETVRDIAVPEARFLNDMTVLDGALYVSDSRRDRIYRLADGAVSVWREGAELDGVNGLLGLNADGQPRMLVSTMTAGALFDATGVTAAGAAGWRQIAAGMVPADGIGVVPEDVGGGYLVSAWRGEIYHVSEAGVVTSLLDTREEGILQNDLSMTGDMVIAPNWDPDTVTAWRVVAGE